MTNDTTNLPDVDAGATSAGSRPNLGVGLGVTFGAGLGLVVGMLFGEMLLGIAYGAGLGTVAGAVVDLLRRRASRKTPPHR